MGRQKQTAPLQRAPSSNLMHLPEESKVLQDAANGTVSAKATPAPEVVADSPGLAQLVICVLGIYAAL